MANTTGKKYGGRKAGTPNLVTVDLRVWLSAFLESQTQQIEKDWQQLTPGQRLFLFERLLRFCLPLLQRTEVKAEIDKLNDEQLDHLLNQLRNGQT